MSEEPNNLWECFVPKKRRTKFEMIKGINDDFNDLNYKIYSKRGCRTKRIIQNQLRLIEKFENKHLPTLERINFFDNVFENPLAMKYKIRFNIMKLKYNTLKQLHDKFS